tara:strand:- start:145 stop:321 length:177 start_codon:yes stop_codon:yes gene_type:complete
LENKMSVTKSRDHSYFYLQESKRIASEHGYDYDKLPEYDRRHNNHKQYFYNLARKIGK